MENGEDPVLQFHSENCDLLNEISNIKDKEGKRLRIRQYLEKFEVDKGVVVPNFGSDWQWFNVENPLSLEGNVHEKILVLDFFTYCCINCIHILPDLEALEHAYADTDGVVIIGVHSAKFDNEKVSENILSAVLRYNITHPVVNDVEAKLWHKLQISCWPTFAIVSPQGHLLCLLTGEGHRETLLNFVGEAVKYYETKKALCHAPIGIKLAKENYKESTLSFPGKVCINDSASRLAIADTGHHRIVLTDENGIIKDIIGGKKSGFRDGCYNFVQFRSPQGLCFHGDSAIYVADTDNHAIRKIDLVKQTVTTVAGTGSQGQDYKGGGDGTEQAISSPWDVIIAPDNPDVLFIAMAGTHQIWNLYLEDGTGLKGAKYTKGTCINFAGSGSEENRNNNYPHRAAFAQPSGLAVGRVPEDSATYTLFVADSESSTIRAVSLKDGSVKGLVGGSIDPMDLFAFGDADGKANKARLQHPLGVAVIPGSLMVADSYNHKIKVVNPLTRSCTTVLGSGSPGNITGLSNNTTGSVLNEPGGLAAHPSGKTLLIADTNNHSIKVLNINTRELSELPVIESNIQKTDQTDYKPKKPQRLSPKMATEVKLDSLKVTAGQELDVQLCVGLPETLQLNREAPNRWAMYSNDETFESALGMNSFGKLTCVSNFPLTKLTVPTSVSTTTDLQVHTSLYMCTEDGTCAAKSLIFVQPMEISDSSEITKTTEGVKLKYEINM